MSHILWRRLALTPGAVGTGKGCWQENDGVRFAFQKVEGLAAGRAHNGPMGWGGTLRMPPTPGAHRSPVKPAPHPSHPRQKDSTQCIPWGRGRGASHGEHMSSQPSIRGPAHPHALSRAGMQGICRAKGAHRVHGAHRARLQPWAEEEASLVGPPAPSRSPPSTLQNSWGVWDGGKVPGPEAEESRPRSSWLVTGGKPQFPHL